MRSNIYIFILFSATFISNIVSETLDIIIKENIPGNKLIYDLSLFSLHGFDSSKNKIYYLVSNKKANSIFVLNTDGKLLTSKLIDRELLCSEIDECCKNKEPCLFSIMVAVSSPVTTLPRTFECRIQIEDENDNSPKFDQNNITILIKESEPVGSLFKLPLAIDLDSEKFSVKQYKLVESHSISPTFSLELSRTGVSHNLQLIHKLDREKKASYQLTLIAIDGGNPPLTGTLSIDVKVGDVNDNPPRLIRNNYKRSLKENEFITETIITIEAEDPDENENAIMNFKIIDEIPSQNDATKYFRIEQTTGRIFLNEKLDFEKQEKYRFFVEVSNKNGNVESATATVFIDVENLNDEVPEISINYLNFGKNNANIQENDERTKFVALATVTDKDKGSGGQVSCKLTNYHETFEIQIKDASEFPNQYNIQTKVSLDREKVAFYKIMMECEDRGDPILRAKKEINVMVTDINDNDPVINIEKDINVKENCPRNTLVTKIQAIDDDEGKNGELVYSISKSDEQTLRMLEIDSVSGDLRTKEVIDREADIDVLRVLIVQLSVSDKGNPPRSVAKTFAVNILDENDNPPQFTNDIIEFFVTENQQPRYTLGEILVTDKDDESKLKVNIVPSPDYQSNPFVLFKRDSKFFLNTTRSLDREKEALFLFNVIASDDSSAISHTVTAKVRVVVKDENDNAPSIIFPSHRNFTVLRLSFHERIGFTVLTVSATDKDSSDSNNGKLNYQIFDNKYLFNIDSNNGVITTTRLMTRSDIGRWNVKVTVRDFGSPSKETAISLMIDVDDSKPQSYSDSYKDNEDNGKFISSNYLWTKEGFLIISLVILLLFLLICVCMVLYMRHIRGLFPAIPDIFLCCRRTTKSRKGSKSSSCGKFVGHASHLDSNQRNSPLNIQQTNRILQEKGLPPYYVNQYDSSSNGMSFPIDQHLSINSYRQYETMGKYQPYSGGANFVPSIGTYSYDKLFYSPSTSTCEGPMQIPVSKLNYDIHSQTIPSSLSINPPASQRFLNNMDRSPLIQENFNDLFPSDSCQKSDDAEKFSTDHSIINSPDPRPGHGRPTEKIDTYAITYPLEQSTFV